MSAWKYPYKYHTYIVTDWKKVCAPSLPVVVIVHGNQEPHAWATILWDNAFAEWGRQPFLVPDKVPWSQLAKTLNIKFRASCGMGLSEDNLRYLASKAFRWEICTEHVIRGLSVIFSGFLTPCHLSVPIWFKRELEGREFIDRQLRGLFTYLHVHCILFRYHEWPFAHRSHGYNHDFSSAMMSWSQFCKEPLPDRSFTFWDWFHAVMKLTKEDLRGLWIDGQDTLDEWWINPKGLNTIED